MTTERKANVMSGPGCLRDLANVLERFPGTHCLLVTGQRSFEASGADEAIAILEPHATVTRFADFGVNPKVTDALRGVAVAREVAADHIVAIGGGSVIDMAKLIKAFLTTTPGQEAELVKGTESMRAAGLPLCAIPTTSGSGSEATHYAVAYLNETKYSLASPYLLPDAVLLDGRLTASSTPYQRACSGFDALAQAIESAWAASANDFTKAVAFEAIERIASVIHEIVGTSPSMDALQEMIEAANLAGSAINVTKTTAAHAFSYGFTTTCGVPHGHAVWLTLPEIYACHQQHADSGNRQLRLVIDEIWNRLSLGYATNRANSLKDFMALAGLEPDMTRIGASDITVRRKIADSVNLERMSNNPIPLSEAHIRHVLRL